MSEDKLELMRQMVTQLNQAADAYYDGKAEQMTDYHLRKRKNQKKLKNGQKENQSGFPGN